MYSEILRNLLLSPSNLYVVARTKYTIHHIEKLTASCKDRGRFKWLAETDMKAWDENIKDDEIRRSHIDSCDYFPRVYFSLDCFLVEFSAWLQMRNLEITDIKVPKL